MKTCRKCGVSKPLSEFWNEAKAKDGKQGTCKPCNYAQSERWKRENPDRHRANKQRQAARQKHNHRKWKYGLTMERFEAMREAQGWSCAICGKDGGNRGLVVDHDHETGVIRGLLCTKCNGALGSFGDNVAGLQRAIDYLQRSQDMTDIRKTSKAVEAPIVKQGHTTNGDFGSNPNARVKGGRTARDITIPTAKG